MQCTSERTSKETRSSKDERPTEEAGYDWNMPGILPASSSDQPSLCRDTRHPVSHGSLLPVRVSGRRVTFRVVLFDQRTCSSACPAPSGGWRRRSGLSAGTCAAARSPGWRRTKFYQCRANGKGAWQMTCLWEFANLSVELDQLLLCAAEFWVFLALERNTHTS